LTPEGVLIGLLGLANKPGGYTEQDLEFLQPIVNSNANFIKTIHLARRRQEAEREREETNNLFRLLSESLSDIITYHDLESTIRFVSPSVYRILGYRPEQLIGRKPSEVFGIEESRSFRRNTSEILVIPPQHKHAKWIGIPEDEQKYIVNSFYRTKNTESVHGTGLGLPIVQEFACRLGADVLFESRQNKGTTFKLTMGYGR
jgi:PAS domain S-box-containing protein